MRNIYLYIICISIVSCATLQQAGWQQPQGFPPPVYDFTQNPLTPEKILAGRILFYDPILSADSSISCASCHSSYNAFAHTDHKLSHGIHNRNGMRNAPGLFNLAWQTSFMWDGAIEHLDMQALAPINSATEMGSTTADVVNKLQQSALYKSLFKNAFGDTIITGQHVLQALSAFELTLVSNHAKYDAVKAGKTVFTQQEAKGYALFLQYCNACHTEPLFTNYSFANNGLSPDTILHDQGRVRITDLTTDVNLFKVPSLRNLSYTFPYMHDGRYAQLSQVLQHYAGLKENQPDCTPPLNQGLVLSSNDRVDLIAFLLTLDDQSFAQQTDYQYPRNILTTH